MARLQIDVRLAGPGDEAALEARFGDLAAAVRPVVAREQAGFVFLVIASADPEAAAGTLGGEHPDRSLGHGTPSWDRPSWDSPRWDDPDWQEPGWDAPGWSSPAWSRPSWDAPAWETTPPALDPLGLPVPYDAVATSLQQAPTIGTVAVFTTDGPDRDRLFIDLEVLAPVAPELVGLVQLEPVGEPPATLRAVAGTLREGFREPLLVQCLHASLRRVASTKGYAGLEAFEAVMTSD